MMRPLLFAASIMAVAASSDCPGQPRQITAPCGIGFNCDSTSTTVAAVQLGPFPTTLAVGQSAVLPAVAVDQFGDTVTSAVFTYSSADTTIATISAAGLATARAAGSDVLTAASNGFQASTTLVVVDSGLLARRQ